ncbi:LacI family DNA-binding transcriptional regulator [Algoriphagus sp. CAU 1675]|uniref:LacI family DNA-binding transcriptional regulator n=1 Tax=Algoriphagus sp. CAU 1675 TaxID=3032597 RepID=UPI0023DA9B88|nr:LacI family DNA-binding transcriptional regulator [Algoriphagus sp. CAU 1675]MDF2158309.1 LacI family DNA-binding transcriptional regulator [Algoriphagus sp. CAU 1675]
MQDKRRITLKDIARDLGISISTASRALNSYSGISDETIKMVKDYAEKHNYVPNSIAVNFRKNKTLTIGMIVPELVHHFFSSVISGAISEANKQGYRLLVSQSDESLNNEIRACRSMLAGSVDGLIISISNETQEGSHIREFLDEGKPVIQFDKIIENLKTPKVITDDFESAYIAVKHLIDQGYKKIAHINGRKEVKNSIDRLQGYKQALLDHRLEFREDWVPHCTDISEKEGFDYAQQLMNLPTPPDAIFCITDLVALGALNFLKKNGYKVPQEVGVMGFSNWKIAEVVGPGLSSVDQHGFEMGEKATSLLLELLKEGLTGENKTYKIDTDLVIRESTQKS